MLPWFLHMLSPLLLFSPSYVSKLLPSISLLLKCYLFFRISFGIHLLPIHLGEILRGNVVSYKYLFHLYC